jgi:hypothetical protein
MTPTQILKLKVFLLQQKHHMLTHIATQNHNVPMQHFSLPYMGANGTQRTNKIIRKKDYMSFLPNVFFI